MAKPAHPSFEAVREFQSIRERTDNRGDIGDSVSILASDENNGVKTYKIVTGIVVKYRSDGGRIVLDYNGKERSVDSSDVRKYVRLIEKSKPDQAHENYRTIEHFAMLKNAEPHTSRKIGESVAILTKDDEENPVIKYGIISRAFISRVVINNSGYYYNVTHRDGTITEYVHRDHVAII